MKNADLIRAIDNEIAHRAGSVRFVWGQGSAPATRATRKWTSWHARMRAIAVRMCAKAICRWKDGSSLVSGGLRGTDVPEDARMPMDGAISAAEYHMGRGQGDSATTGTGDSGADTANSSNSTKLPDRQHAGGAGRRFPRPCGFRTDNR